jgi:hypothetical protein
LSTTSPPKLSVGSAWAAWEADGSPASGSEFLGRVASWVEGTAAQLLRARWGAGVKRPTSAEVQDRLRHHLRIVANAGNATYLEALELARRGVIDEIRRSQPIA